MKDKRLFRWLISLLLIALVAVSGSITIQPALADDPPPTPVPDEMLSPVSKDVPGLAGLLVEQPLSLELKDLGQVDSPLLKGTVGSDGTVTIMSEDFEGPFPRGGWVVDGHWGKSPCRPYRGSYSAWVEGGSTLPCNSYYHNSERSWMIYGPFDLSDATSATLTFHYWLNSEVGYDWLFRGASINGINFYGVSKSGNSGGWRNDWALDLTNVPTLGNLVGQPRIWIAFVWDTDGSVSRSEGAYVDDIVLTKITPVQSQTFQETTVQVRYGSWQGVSHSSADGGTYRQSAVEDATVRFSFTGTEVTWITAKGRDKGIAEVSIDEVSRGTFDLYSPTERWGVALTFSGLPYGSHTLAVRVTGAKNAASMGRWVVVDAFRVR